MFLHGGRMLRRLRPPSAAERREVKREQPKLRAIPKLKPVKFRRSELHSRQMWFKRLYGPEHPLMDVALEAQFQAEWIAEGCQRALVADTSRHEPSGTAAVHLVAASAGS